MTDPEQAVPEGLDAETAELVGAWLASLDPAFEAAKSDPAREGGTWDSLGGCGLET